MKTKNYGMYAIALAIVVVGALAFGVPVCSLGVLGFVLICPLMMLFMMRSMGGMGSGEDHTGHGCEHDPTRQDHPAEPRS